MIRARRSERPSTNVTTTRSSPSPTRNKRPENATRRSPLRDALVSEFYRFPFEPYAPIRRQAFNILREVNRRRKRAGYDRIPTSCIWLKRRIVKPQ